MGLDSYYHNNNTIFAVSKVLWPYAYSWISSSFYKLYVFRCTTILILFLHYDKF